jgi:protein-tyrosine phosphatase
MPGNQLAQASPNKEATAETPAVYSVKSRFSGLISGNFGTHRGLIRLLLGEAEYLAGRLNEFLEPDLYATQRLVFVCLGNINRSPFGEHVATSLGLYSTSIGLATSTGAPAFATAVTTAQRFDIDLTAHKATDFVDYEYREGDLLLAMEIRHVHRLIALGIPPTAIALLGHWSTPHRIHIHDPHTLSDTYFRTCFSVINAAVRELAQECRRANSPCLAR